MNCSATTSCSNPKLMNMENEFFCFNCYQSFIKEKDEDEEPKKVNPYQCCDEPEILFNDNNDFCINCGTIYEKIINELPYLENDEYQTNILHKSKKIHVPYQYLRFTYPEIKYTEIYDFIQTAINFIKEYYNLKRRPYSKYVSFLYNFYRINKPNIPEIKNFVNNKDLIIEQDVIDHLYQLLNINPNDKQITNIKANAINNKPTTNKEDFKKYYYFNKSKNKYFKKKRYCQFNHCYKIGNFEESNQKFCKEHTKNGVNINNKILLFKCQYKKCKKNTKATYCPSHRYECIDNDCKIRIMKNDSYCKNCK